MDNSHNEFNYEPEDIESLNGDYNEIANKNNNEKQKEDSNVKVDRKPFEYNIDTGLKPNIANKPSSDPNNIASNKFTYDKNKPSDNDDHILELIDGSGGSHDINPVKEEKKQPIKNDLFDDEDNDVLDLEEANKANQSNKPNNEANLIRYVHREKVTKEKEESYGDYAFDDLLGKDKKKEDNQQLFLTEKEPKYNNISNKEQSNKLGNEMNYNDLLNNDVFNKNKTNKNKDNDNEEDDDYGGFEDLIDNSNDKDISNNKNKDKDKEQEHKASLKINPITNTITMKEITKQESNKKNDIIYHNPSSHSLIKSPITFVSSFDQSKHKYSQLKIEIEKVLNTIISSSNSRQLANQNVKMLQYLSDLNVILTDITDHTKIPVKKQSLPKKESLIKTSINNDKILERYKTEYLKLKARVAQLSDSSYEMKLNDDLNEVKAQIAYYEKDNKTLKTTQKISERILENQARDPEKAHMKLKRIEMDYESIKNQYEMYTKKVERNKQSIKENEAKIKELSDWKVRLEEKARDMYGITVFENVAFEEQKEKEKRDKITKMQKKIVVLDGSIESNKRKYEQEIVRNEREIFRKEEDKLELLKILNEKRMLSENCAKMIKALYSPTLMQQENERGYDPNIQANYNDLTDRDKEKDKTIITPRDNEMENSNTNQLIKTNDKPRNATVHKERSNQESNIGGGVYKPIQSRDDKRDELILRDNRLHQQTSEYHNPNPQFQPKQQLHPQKNNSDCIFPKIEPKGNQGYNIYINKNDERGNILNNNTNGYSNNNSNTGHNSRKPNFAFGFKKTEMAQKEQLQPQPQQEKNYENNNNQLNNNNNLSNPYKPNRKESIGENIDQDKNYNNANGNIINLDKRKEEEVKKDIIPYEEDIEGEAIDLYPQENKVQQATTEKKDLNPEPDFLQYQPQTKSDLESIKPKRNVPMFLDEEDLVESPKDQDHIINIGRINLNNNNTLKQNEDIDNNNVKEKEQEMFPERKRLAAQAAVKEKTKEEKDNEDAFNNLLKSNNNKPAISTLNNQVKPSSPYQPYDEFADLEEFII